jgi:hypothetical protein
LPARLYDIRTLATNALIADALAPDETVVERHFQIGIVRLRETSGLVTAVNAVVPVAREKTTTAAVRSRGTAY